MTHIRQAIENLKAAGFCFSECALDIRIPDAKSLMLETMAEFVPEPVWLPDYDHIASWLGDNKGKGLLLMGNPGVGKTLIAARVIPVLLNAKMGRIMRVVSAFDMNRMEKELAGRRILTLDDIGVEDDKNDYGERRRVFSDIVDRAERRGDILVITTNLSPDGLKARYGERTIDRLRAVTRFVIITGGSFRKQQQKA